MRAALNWGFNDMSELVLTPEQAKFVEDSAGIFLVRNPHGKPIGHLLPAHGGQPRGRFTREEIDAALAASQTNSRTHTTAEVLAYLRSLEDAQ
jgi:hypothetical protein